MIRFGTERWRPLHTHHVNCRNTVKGVPSTAAPSTSAVPETLLIAIPQAFINCGYAGILTPNITVKMCSTRGRPRPHTAILRHLFTAPKSESHDTIDGQFSSQQQSLLRGNTCVVSGPIPLRQVLGDHQNRPSTCPSSPIRMLLAAGTLGNPGIVIISPQMATMNPAPAARRTSRMGTM